MSEPNLTKVYKAFSEFLEEGGMFGMSNRNAVPNDWTDEEMKYFQRLIDANMNADGQADTLYHSQGDPVRDAAIGECIGESIHQDFDGWEDRDKVVIMLYLYDLGIAVKETVKHYQKKENDQ